MAPLRKIQIKTKNSTWLATDTIDSIRMRDQCRIQAANTGDRNLWSEYKTMRNRCTALVRRDKKQKFTNIYDKIEEEGNTKELYNVTKSRLGWNTGGAPENFVINGKTVSSPKIMASHQLEYFCKKISTLMYKLPARSGDPCSYLIRAMNKWTGKDARPVFKLREVTLLETVNYLKKLKNSATSGFDTIDSLALKSVAIHIAKPLQKIINLSITKNKFANKWRIANIIPLYKGKGLIRTSPSSYRPISLLSVTSKIVERAVQHQLLNFMETTNQLNYNNHAYRKHLSTTTAMLHLSDTIHRATDLNQVTVLMTLDESSAFDCVSHDTLLRKLKIYNFSTETCDWISSYLKHRTNYVTVGAHKSEMRSVNHGVPQGSVLGPLLYTLYTNELADVIKNDDCNHQNHMDDSQLFSSNCPNCGALPSYADDATYCYSSNSRLKNQDKLITNLQKIKLFLNNNSLTINESKTTLLELMVRQKLARITGTPPSILTKDEKDEDKLITAGTHIRLLGGNVQKSLSWQAHFETGERPLLKTLETEVGLPETPGASPP